MGLKFGELAKIRGIIYYRLAPHEQKPFANAFTQGLANFVPRTTATILTWLPPFVIGTILYVTCEEYFHRSKRKTLRDYMDEVDPNAEPE